jgi:hypothetical protein
MHGATLREIEAGLPELHEHLVDILGRLLWKALIHQFPRDTFDGRTVFGYPSTYVSYAVHGIAHIQTVVPTKPDGDLDMSFRGMTMKMEADGPPQSALPSLIAMTPEQYERLTRLSYTKGEHQKMCSRILGRSQQHGDKVEAAVLSTDMVAIKASLSRGEVGGWQDLFREILQP